MDKAWHLRSDGKAFPVKVHMYCMEDDDLSSEAEAASFIIKSESSDQDIAHYVLDAWMALLIEQEISYDADEEEIEHKIVDCLHSLPYHFQYPLDDKKLLSIHRSLDNYHDVDTLYEFTDKVREGLHMIQDSIKKSLNQQFCRVRYGGQYNSVSGNNEIWFRVSSIGFNWNNVIYKYAMSISRSYNLSSITICRDSESDGGFDSKKEYFYRAKDGVYYEHMPIDEFFREEHEHSMYFESNLCAGVLCKMRECFSKGMTYNQVFKFLESRDISYEKDVWSYFLHAERRNCICRSSDSIIPSLNRL